MVINQDFAVLLYKGIAVSLYIRSLQCISYLTAVTVLSYYMYIHSQIRHAAAGKGITLI